MPKALLVSGSLFVMLMLFGSVKAQQQAPLVQQANLVYEGAFRVPTGANGGSTFDGYGGGALAYNAANNTLFSVGHVSNGNVAEITIPTPSLSTSLTSLPMATYRQGFKDVLEGRRSQVGCANGCPVGGMLVSGNSLIVTAYDSYDASGSQTLSHFKVNRDFAVTGDVLGPYRLGTAGAGRVAGYMSFLPAEWQGPFGGQALTGLCCISIQSRTNSGPGASVFNPGDVGSINPVPGTEVLGYGLDHKPPATVFQSGDTNTMGGIVIAPGTRTALFFGRHGQGTLCYGTGAECNDPVSQYKGYHAYPYIARVWAYDLNDLIAVKNGQKQAYQPLPYSMWPLSTMFVGKEGMVKGATYDPATQRVFVSVTSDAEGNSRPIIHVYKLQTGVGGAALTAPTNLRVIR